MEHALHVYLHKLLEIGGVGGLVQDMCMVEQDGATEPTEPTEYSILPYLGKPQKQWKARKELGP